MSRLNDYRENKNAFNGINAGAPSTIAIPGDRGVVHEASFFYSESGTAASEAVMLDALDRVELLIDGQTYSEYKVPNLIMLDKFYRETFKAGFLPLRFAQYSRNSIEDAEKTSFVPAAHNNPQLRVYINAGRVAPTMENWLQTEGVGDFGREVAKVSPFSAAQNIIKHYTNVIEISSSGNTPTRWRYEHGNERVRGFHLKGANITKVVIKVNEQDRWEFNSIDHLNRMLDQYDPQANYWHIVFEAIGGGSLEAAFNPVFGGQNHKIDFEIYTSDETNVEILAERYAIPKTLPENTAK